MGGEKKTFCSQKSYLLWFDLGESGFVDENSIWVYFICVNVIWEYSQNLIFRGSVIVVEEKLGEKKKN